jgi:hypothetical protein
LRKKPFKDLKAWLSEVEATWTQQLSAFKANAEKPRSSSRPQLIRERIDENQRFSSSHHDHSRRAAGGIRDLHRGNRPLVGQGAALSTALPSPGPHDFRRQGGRGRLLEVVEDDVEPPFVLGRVEVWDPPSRLVFSMGVLGITIVVVQGLLILIVIPKLGAA